ncbi:ribosomal protein L2 (nucleomorph) [Bigelowiella natans]|uniref:Ribosomal protein L2 n=1 Tax=Bigelowiella natans TaxID=227086 RepID=Q3LW80_BIGNA|nr:ribosomal protein L2 [Bigelowiella natans]ABA27286.1 ribosomal protein L2 [Bigelowiella natans]|mmetsp:Transcript_5869/g.7127  ORF Transcript_5869/g.7127 Transcript_5869/m.7127 type:complete len:154 (-) Transcript_5869:2541-3002(-)
MKNSIKKVVYIKSKGGQVASASVLAQKIGPYGLSPKKIGEDFAKKTKKNWDGIIVTIKLTIIKKNAYLKIVPSVSSLLKREMQLYGKPSVLTFKQLIKISKKVQTKSYSKAFKGVVKEVLGTCCSMGILIDRFKAKSFLRKIENDEIAIPKSI